MPWAKRVCAGCQKTYQPGKKSPDGLHDTYCVECRRLIRIDASSLNNPFKDFRPSDKKPPFVTPPELPKREMLAPPLRQAVFDLETWGLDRGWGVTLAACIMVHGDKGIEWYQFDLTQTAGWPDIRSNDSEVIAATLKVLASCHVAYAHNGRNFDFKWLRSVALKYGMPQFDMKLIDPCQIARAKFRIGSNSLENIANFLGLEMSKLHVPEDVWRTAILDNRAESWELLRQRCKSDVEILNAVSGRVVGHAGMIDSDGSAWRRG